MSSSTPSAALAAMWLPLCGCVNEVWYCPLNNFHVWMIFKPPSQNKGKALLECADVSSPQMAMSHMNSSQLNGAVLKVKLSDVPLCICSCSPPPPTITFCLWNRHDHDHKCHHSLLSLPHSHSHSPELPALGEGPPCKSGLPPPTPHLHLNSPFLAADIYDTST